MIFAYLKQQWLAGGHDSLGSRLLSIWRSLRVLWFYRDHQALCQLDVYRNYVAHLSQGDLFHHLSHRGYLLKGLTPSQRVQCVLGHYHFEETTFNAAYKQAVYRDGGLLLWQHASGDDHFSLRLDMAPRAHAEGDLAISLIANGSCLHQLSFSWMEGALAGVGAPMVPFVARNQGRWADSGAAFEAFERAFPNNSPSFFCFAAMQGVAQSVGMDTVIAVKCTANVSYEASEDKQFANAYDNFWKVLGGVETPGPVWRIALPFYLKPLADMPSKHRKRAALRREFWRAIGDAARSTLQRHLLHARAHHEHAAPVREPAEA
ncbi:hypothetical protein GCM10027321_40890 [Massilia terrae]|uniref:VirK/YbjX family protein n=1 Tax=Massilia terrae TaxID=1811224 RepID=A0ABT2CU74_9BURK|nr:VirK/YbjX family protein [Massilia terrae]MCS0656633.1 VirK/YbjX family protein [Massilia terrae]